VGLLATLYQISSSTYHEGISGEYEKFVQSDMGEPLDVGKAWGVIDHLLLRNSNKVLFKNGHQIEIISEHAEIHSPETTKRISIELNKLLTNNVLNSLDVNELNKTDIYPEGWEGESVEWVESHLAALAEFTKAAANHSNGLFVVIC